MRSIAVLFATLTMFATQLSAQLITYADWADGPVRHLMTKEELAKWKTIHTDAQAKEFVDLFWARRDPTPDTPRNEFREEFDRRVAVADREFSSANLRGSLSDPGKVLILLGPPYQIGGRGGAAALNNPSPVPGVVPTDTNGNISLPRPVGDAPQRVWTYAHERKPKFIAYPDFVLVFTDEGQNEWQLAHTERVNPDFILAEAVKALIISPDLKKPRFASETASTFNNADLKAAYEAFRASDNQSIGSATLTWGEFVSGEGDPFVASQLYAPAGSGVVAGQDVTLFSVVENDSGAIVDVHEEALKMIGSGNDAYVDESLHLAPGHYKATFGIASGKTILAAKRTELQVDPVDPAASSVSPLILSSSITPLQKTWHADDPFTFGGLKVVPKGDGTFAPVGDLWYFVEMRNPGVNDQKNPAVQVQVEISGTTANGPAHMKLPMTDAEVAPLKGVKNRYAVGLAIPLETFKPGDYTIKVRLTDTVLSKTYELEKPFKISGK
jgi:GWxTD domain-containing protein